jgi:hypothetical protein
MVLKLGASAALLTGALMTTTVLVSSPARADDRTGATAGQTGTIVLAQASEKKKKKAGASEGQGRTRSETPPPNDRGS